MYLADPGKARVCSTNTVVSLAQTVRNSASSHKIDKVAQALEILDFKSLVQALLKQGQSNQCQTPG